ncbi:MAG: tRNA (adenosine(37)-N6)-threonylcarbamoyltransferase complex dimerization subunit type 1 TsaB [Thermomicrobiales bacterium]|nr:MAG: tRNA (adenosine(37)-N6)-threonylcarbamoyltransferase complex dimerization subunit type 1 TsaB [Thermomicrobiales bacterium]
MTTLATRETKDRVNSVRSWVAAIDTSSDRAGVALFDGVDVAVLSWNAHRNHTVDTLAQLDHLLRLGGLTLHQLDGVAIATGPGSFSALRVGLSIAKGLAFSLGLPLAGISTTSAIAASAGPADRPIIPVMPAGRGRVVWSRYPGVEADAHQNTTVDELRAVMNAEHAMVVSESPLPGIGNVLVLPAGARVEQIARLGWPRIRDGERDDPAALEPMYVHGRGSPEATAV